MVNRRSINDIRLSCITETIDEVFNDDLKSRTTGFVLAVFPLDKDDASMQLVSNMPDKADMLKRFKEMIEHIKNNEVTIKDIF